MTLRYKVYERFLQSASPSSIKIFLPTLCPTRKNRGHSLPCTFATDPPRARRGTPLRRLSRRDHATHDITSTWSENQQVIGPVLIVPYRYYYTEKKEVFFGGHPGLQDVEVSQQDNAYFLPAHLNIEGQVTPKRLHRGIYQAVVYDATVDLSGDFAAPDFASLNSKNSTFSGTRQA